MAVREIQTGLYVDENQVAMPCEPHDFGIMRWAFPSTFQRGEREEAAARILAHSQQLNQWVGVSWKALADVMLEEYEAQKSVEAVRKRNFKKREEHHVQMVQYIARCVLTLGIYAIFAKKPVLKLEQEPEVESPFSLIFVFGPGAVVTGIRELIDQGLLKLVTIGEGEEAQDIFFPQPAMIARILEVQRR
jgi:hypothetical protein